VVHDPLKPLAGCSDAASLRCAIEALCFVRTDPAIHEQQLSVMPGLTRIGNNEMLFIVDLPPEPK
jgi:hypothetical protein